ncbi:MAG: phenylalanine--tRNA ligase subunit beta [Solirubrobacteraceae bacterium]
MRLPLAWLRDYCDPPLTTEQLAERLDLTGTEVGFVEHHGVEALDRFVVGRVLEAEQHPDADRLSVCRVEVGNGDVAQIVCGAPNVAAGQIVAVARPGAVMPDGTELGRAKLRGVESDGMILAEDELGIGTDHAGILVLDDDLRPGQPLVDALPISTDVIELEITPNRPDCLGVYGLAREVHAITGAPLAAPPWSVDPGATGEVPAASVVVEDPDLCPRFTARVYEDVRVGRSPPWLKARLMAAGQRPINNVVDVTNYVMLLTGHPLHAFDLDRVAGGRLVVRRARGGEQIELLDGAVRTLDDPMVVILDGEGPTSLAGIMGGSRSEVADDTTRVLMEVASWNGPNIQRTSRKLGVRSEASARFEKGLSPDAALEAQVMASVLMEHVVGATLLPGTIDVGGAGPPPATLTLRPERVATLLGIEIPAERCAQTLAALGFGVDGEAPLSVTVPHWRRNDVTREVDLIEEVARVDGVEKLPATLPARRGAYGVLTPVQQLRRRTEDALAARRLDELAGWSFTAPDLPDRLRLAADDPRRAAVVLANPLSSAQSVMRTTLLGSLLDGARHNVTHGARDVRLFELGAVYLAAQHPAAPPEATAPGHGPVAGDAERRAAAQRAHAATLPTERLHAAAVLTGAARPATWREPEPPQADFFAAKGVLEGVAETLRVPLRFEPAGAEPFLHPARAARVLAAGEPAGWLGELHPAVAEAWELPPAAAFEVDLDVLFAGAPDALLYEDVISFPAVHRDLAIVVPEAVPAAEVVETIRTASPLLERVDIFDVYTGEQVGPGRKSLALHLTFRTSDRTLRDEEVDRQIEDIVGALRKLGGELRA